MLTLIPIEKSKINPHILASGPVACTDCHYEGNIEDHYYLLESNEECDKEIDLNVFVKEKLGYKEFTSTFDENGHLIIVARCPKCGSDSIFEDF